MLCRFFTTEGGANGRKVETQGRELQGGTPKIKCLGTVSYLNPSSGGQKKNRRKTLGTRVTGTKQRVNRLTVRGTD